MLKAIHKKVPPCVVAAVLRTWLNGWCTSRRFRQPAATFRLFSSCTGGDELEHYAVCPHAWQYLQGKIGICIESPALLQFFVLDGGTEARCIIGAVHIFAVMGAVNHDRTCGTPVDHGTLRDILWERWRTAMTQHRPLLRWHNDFQSSRTLRRSTQSKLEGVGRSAAGGTYRTIEGQTGHAATHGLDPPTM